jgi:uncharacterized protein (DUF58 family)
VAELRFSRLRLPWIVWRKALRDREIKLELHQPLAVFVMLVLLVWYIAAPSTVIALFLASVFGLVGLSLFWALQMARRVEGRRQLQYAAMQVGDELEELISLRNQSFLPALWVEFVDRSNLPGYTVSSVRAVDGLAEMRWRAHTICTLRGVYTLGPWELRLGEPFGLFQVSQIYLDPQQILVYPPLAPLPGEMLPHRGVMGDHRPLNQPVSADTADSMAVRTYTAGDPLHKIHWRTTARRGEPYVKVFEPEAASRIWLVPDLDARVQLGEGEDSTEETTVLLAASMAARLLQDRLAVGMYAGQGDAALVLPQRGQAHLWALLERLAPLHSHEENPISAVLGRLQPLISPRDLLVVITPSTDPSWPDALQQAVRARGMGSAEAILLDAQSFGGSGSSDGLLALLAARGFQARLVKKGQIEAIKGAYGNLSRWEFTISATGKAIARRAPRRAAALIFAGQGEETQR